MKKRYRDHITEYLDNEHKGKWQRHLDTYESIEWSPDYTPPSKTDVETAVDVIKSAWDSKAYSRNRQAEYPDWGSQLNKIYDDGLTKWKSEMVDPVKTKWPKDNSGPK